MVSLSCVLRSSSYSFLSFQERLAAPSVSFEDMAQSTELPLLLLLNGMPTELECTPREL